MQGMITPISLPEITQLVREEVGTWICPPEARVLTMAWFQGTPPAMLMQ